MRVKQLFVASAECLGSLVLHAVCASLVISPPPLADSSCTADPIQTHSPADEASATLEEAPPSPCHNETYFRSPSWDMRPVWVASREAQ